MSEFMLLSTLPFDEGEHVTGMTCWKPHDIEFVVLATSRHRIFLLRVSDKVEVAGPLEFATAEMRNRAGRVPDRGGMFG